LAYVETLKLKLVVVNLILLLKTSIDQACLPILYKQLFEGC